MLGGHVDIVKSERYSTAHLIHGQPKRHAPIMHTEHHTYLLQALAQAQTRRGFTAPNPAVGAVIVKDGHVIATGTHFAAGHAHAERDALNKLDHQAKGATIYVTLEPCCITGRTPPCTEALREHGIAEVFYAFQDPNPKVTGRGATQLQAAGIPCQHVPMAEIDAFYQSYAYWWRTGKPWLTAKLALSLDGKIAGPQGEPIAITGSEANTFTHQQRKACDAIFTTAATVLADDPQLNVRLNETIIAKPLYVFDRQLVTPHTAQVFKTAEKLTFFHDPQLPKAQIAAMRSRGAACIGLTNLSDIVEYLGQQGVHDVWIETGGQCFSALITLQLLQRAWVLVAPKTLGNGAKSAFSEAGLFSAAKQINWSIKGGDVMAEIAW